jgi:DNA-binding transcriptional ArsR family regulator
VALSNDDVFLIDDLETLRLMTQPLRLRLLEALRTSPEPLAVKELAAALGVPQTRLYHHVNLLEERGLIRVARTRLVSGIVEKRYAVTAARIGVDRTLLAPAAAGDEGLETLEVLLSVVLDEVRSEIKRAVRAGLIDLELSGEDKIGPRRLVLGRKWLWLTDAEVEEFERALVELGERFEHRAAGPGPRETAEDGARLYEQVIGFYPAVSPPIGRPQADDVGGDEG